MKKVIAVKIMIMFICAGIFPSTGNLVSFDDTTPPDTTHFLNPSEPDGENGYYINDVEVTLNAIDNQSGVKEIRYRIDFGNWIEIPGGTHTFIMNLDGNNVPIEYYAIDNAGNKEDIKSFTIDMDQTKPIMNLDWQAYVNRDHLWNVEFTAFCWDETSTINRVTFYLNESWQETYSGLGPTYTWLLCPVKNYKVVGFICNKNIIEDNVSFY